MKINLSATYKKLRNQISSHTELKHILNRQISTGLMLHSSDHKKYQILIPSNQNSPGERVSLLILRTATENNYRELSSILQNMMPVKNIL